MNGSYFHYDEVMDWEHAPAGYRYADVSDVALDSNDDVYLLTRYDTRVCIYDRDGNFIKSWGETVIGQGCHGIAVAPDSTVYIVDWAEHCIARFTNDGELLGFIGKPRVASDTGVDPNLGNVFDILESIKYGGPPFNGPTKLAFGPHGDFFVSDGYRNARIHHFSTEGQLIKSWGEPGSRPGQFRNPHYVHVTDDNRVLVADRENHRIQVFDAEGRFLDQYPVQRPSAVCTDANGLIFVAALEFTPGLNRSFGPHIDRFLPGLLCVLDRNGALLLQQPLRTCPGDIAGANGIAVDSRGDVYVAEVPYSMYESRDKIPVDCHAIHKFRRTSMPDVGGQ